VVFVETVDSRRPGFYSGVQTGSGAGYRWLFPRRVKRLGREADHSPPSSAEVKNGWSCTSTPPYVFLAWRLVKYRNKFNFTLLLAKWIATELGRINCVEHVA